MWLRFGLRRFASAVVDIKSFLVAIPLSGGLSLDLGLSTQSSIVNCNVVILEDKHGMRRTGVRVSSVIRAESHPSFMFSGSQSDRHSVSHVLAWRVSVTYMLGLMPAHCTSTVAIN